MAWVFLYDMLSFPSLPQWMVWGKHHPCCLLCLFQLEPILHRHYLLPFSDAETQMKQGIPLTG